MFNIICFCLASLKRIAGYVILMTCCMNCKHNLNKSIKFQKPTYKQISLQNVSRSIEILIILWSQISQKVLVPKSSLNFPIISPVINVFSGHMCSLILTTDIHFLSTNTDLYLWLFMHLVQGFHGANPHNHIRSRIILQNNNVSLQ